MVDKRSLNNSIQLLFLTVAYISAMCCLIRTDFNFALAFFGYYMFLHLDNVSTSTILIIVNSILLFVDLIWLLSIGGIWTADIANDDAWNREHALRVFAIVMSVINMIIKISLTACLGVYRNKQLQEDGQNLIPQHAK